MRLAWFVMLLFTTLACAGCGDDDYGADGPSSLYDQAAQSSDFGSD